MTQEVVPFHSPLTIEGKSPAKVRSTSRHFIKFIQRRMVWLVDHELETATDIEIRGGVLFQDSITHFSLICLDKRKPINFKYSFEITTRNTEQKYNHYPATFRRMTYDDDDDNDQSRMT